METRRGEVVFNSGVRRISGLLRGFIVVQMALLAFTTQSWGAKAKTDAVNCGKGQTIADVLKNSDGVPITIIVSGVCNENIVIAQDDVTLVSYTSPGATISGTDPNQNTITITGTRTVINGLIVSGGWNGIGVNGNSTTIVNTTVEGNLYNGIAFTQGGNGTIDNCTVTNNDRHGVAFNGGNAIITNSRISSNTGTGIAISISGSAWIGFKTGSFARNTITNNGGGGIEINMGGSAYIGGNTISRNGYNSNSLFGRAGIRVLGASAFLLGDNIITGNFSSGVLANGSSVYFGGGQSMGLPNIFNEVSGNGMGTAAQSLDDCEILAIMGSSLEIGLTKMTPSNSTTSGLCVNRRSTARLSGGITLSNFVNGIAVNRGGGLFVESSNVIIEANKGWGIKCSRSATVPAETDHESSISPLYTDPSTGRKWTNGIFRNNALGDMEDACSAF